MKSAWDGSRFGWLSHIANPTFILGGNRQTTITVGAKRLICDHSNQLSREESEIQPVMRMRA